ncbi:hypothetical protein ABW19_dt0204995 [Dactylella cylindrospora]|nr:hypothetical protein ABW19_dt0204995 [Dactylella cylindrospora]
MRIENQAVTGMSSTSTFLRELARKLDVDLHELLTPVPDRRTADKGAMPPPFWNSKPTLSALPAELLTLILTYLPWKSQYHLSLACPQITPLLASASVRRVRYLDNSHEATIQERLRSSWQESFGQLAMRPKREVELQRLPVILLDGYFAYTEEISPDDAPGEPNPAWECRLVRGTYRIIKRDVYLTEPAEGIWNLNKSPILDDTILPSGPGTDGNNTCQLGAFAFGDVVGWWQWVDGRMQTVYSLMLEIGGKLMMRWRDIYSDEEKPKGIVFHASVFDEGIMSMSVWSLDEAWEGTQEGKEVTCASPTTALRSHYQLEDRGRGTLNKFQW